MRRRLRAAERGVGDRGESEDSRELRRQRRATLEHGGQGMQRIPLEAAPALAAPAWIDVDLDAIAHNVRAFRRLLPPACRLIAVVKANAYGHGAAQVGRALEDAGADLLACADIEEGATLRAAGVRADILIFGALSVSDLDGLFDCRLTPTISSPGAARAVQAAAARHKQRVRYHLKIDTGMNRLGFRFDNLRRTLPEVLQSENLDLEAVFTHFATADDPASPLFDEQRRRFDRVLADLPTLGARPRYRHAANSAAVVRDPRVWFERVRPGLLLYGIVPPPLSSSIPLAPAMTLSSRITAVKGMRAGEVTGYGARFTAQKPTKIAIVPAGYADGLDLRLAGRGSVLVRGRRAPIIGSVCMDMIMIDVTGLDVSPGDEVVFIGRQGGDTIDAREMADTIGSIPWEIVCRVGSRIERVYA
jgi:alanine racemase